MLPYNIDYEHLRKDLTNYYGTAAYSGMPMAMMDVFAVESMSANELLAEAQHCGLNMSRYATTANPTSTLLTDLLLASMHAPSYRSVPTPQPDTQYSKNIAFPTYEKAVSAQNFICSDQANDLIETRPNHWVSLLFAQYLSDNLVTFRRYKRPSASNPFSQRIRQGSSGRKLIHYMAGYAGLLSENITSLGSAVDSFKKGYAEHFRAAQKKNDPAPVFAEVQQLLNPYIRFLAMLVDLDSIEYPAEFKPVYSEYKRLVKNILSECDMYYYNLYDAITKEPHNAADIISRTPISIATLHTKKISDYITQNVDLLKNAEIKRKTFL